jgi:pyridoxal phosphate enzyme (YggS family)
MVFANLQQNYALVRERIEKACFRSSRPVSDVRMVAVTKTHPAETVQALIDMGITDIGENKVQEMEAKVPLLHGNYTMHMIGHLQTNKAAKAVALSGWIQSIDSVRLLEKVQTCAQTSNKKIRALVEVNTSGEPSKSGCTPDECYMLAERMVAGGILEFCGLMTVGPLGASETATRAAFQQLKKLGEQCKGLSPVINLSMGMSLDFEWAIEEGATIVRIGSLLVGSRDYQK